MTRQRRRIVQTVSSLAGSFTVDDLSAALENDGGGATATLYRAVDLMLASGFIARVGSREGSALYARCHTNDHHHHHIVCDSCGRIAHATCPYHTMTTAPSETDGFVITRHEISLYGLCPECAALDKRGE